jgi:imidazolonepropionase-like amidohydrolase
VRAGADPIEHAWYLTDELLAILAARGGAITPTGAGFGRWLPDVLTTPEGPRRSWFVEGYEGLRRTVVHAQEAGVRVLAGTDSTEVAGDVVAEIEWLVGCGLSPTDALAAASWGAREYLGLPSLIEGAPADIVSYDADPRKEPGVLRHPKHVILKGGAPTNVLCI